MSAEVDSCDASGGQAVSFLVNARLRLRMTQAELARTLRVSIRAVQSYEQGWRTLPVPLAAQLLTLLAIHAGHSVASEPCWKKTNCPAGTRKNCPSDLFADGRFCWVVAGDVCGRRVKGTDKALLQCLVCPVTADFIT